VKQIDADAARLSRAFRAVPATDADGVSLEVFAAIATARRHALAAFGKVLAHDSQDPAKSIALMALSTLGAGLGSQYRSLRTKDPLVARRESRLARDRFTAAADAFLELDRALGCPYGCKKGA
jgi:hypothetical protein